MAHQHLGHVARASLADDEELTVTFSGIEKCCLARESKAALERGADDIAVAESPGQEQGADLSETAVLLRSRARVSATNARQPQRNGTESTFISFPYSNSQQIPTQPL